MIELVIALLLIFWLLGFTGNHGGNLVHLLLVIVLVLILARAIH